MKLKKIEPQLRLDRDKYDPREEYINHSIDIGHYQCPYCDYILEFNTSDFQKKFGNEDSNLHTDIQNEFETFRPINKKLWENFLDFYCPKCNSPVRIIYEPWEFAMGSFGFTVIEIIEQEKK